MEKENLKDLVKVNADTLLDNLNKLYEIASVKKADERKAAEYDTRIRVSLHNLSVLADDTNDNELIMTDELLKAIDALDGDLHDMDLYDSAELLNVGEHLKAKQEMAEDWKEDGEDEYIKIDELLSNARLAIYRTYRANEYRGKEEYRKITHAISTIQEFIDNGLEGDEKPEIINVGEAENIIDLIDEAKEAADNMRRNGGTVNKGSRYIEFYEDLNEIIKILLGN